MIANSFDLFLVMGLSSRQNTVPELQNLYSPLQVEDLPQQILVEENSLTAHPEEKNTILDNVIRRRPNICTTGRYIQTRQQLRKSKVVPGNNTYAGTLREGKKILILGGSQIRRVKRDKLQNSFDNAKSFVRYFSGTLVVHQYIIPSLLKEKPDPVVIHVGSNNITHRILEDFNADKLADEIIDIGKMCSQYGVKDVIISSIFVKSSIKLVKIISQENGAVMKKCEENGFHFVSNDNTLRKHLYKDGVNLTDEGTNIFAGNIVDYIRHFILKEF